MNLGRSRSQRAKGSAPRSRWAAAILGVVALAFGSVLVPAAAQAAPNPAIVLAVSPLENVTNPGQQATIGDTLAVSGTWDATTANPVPGDEFTLALPAELEFDWPNGHAFTMSGPNSDGGTSDWANCAVDTSASPSVLTCTLLPAVAQYPENVKGEFGFDVTATAATTTDTVEFDLNGTPTDAELPDKKPITDGVELPGEWSKTGSWNDGSSDRSRMTWTIQVPGSALAASGQNSVVITDTIGGNHRLCGTAPDYADANFTATTTRPNTPNQTPAGVTFNPTGANGFTVGMAGPFDPDRVYVITYNTCTASGTIDPTGTVYDNTATIDIEGMQGSGIGSLTQNWAPPTVRKTGSFVDRVGNDERAYRWSIQLGPDVVVGHTELTIEDVLSGEHELYKDGDGDYRLERLRVYERFGHPSAPSSSTDITSEFDFTPDIATDGKSFTLDMAIKAGSDFEFKGFAHWYIVQYDSVSTYETLPPGGSEVSNTAAIGGASHTGTIQISGRSFGKDGNINTSTVELGGESYLPLTTLSWRVIVPGEQVDPHDGTAHTGPVTMVDALSGPHEVCSVGDGTLEERLGLRVRGIDQVSTGNNPGNHPPIDLTATATITAEGAIEVTIQEPAGGWDREYQYVIDYATCTSSGGMDPQGTQYGNSATVVGKTFTDTVTQSQRGGGSGQGGASMGSVSVSKKLAADSAAVPDGTVFTVRVDEYAPGTYPGGQPYASYDLQVPLNGDAVNGQSPRGNGWIFVLSEPTFPALDGVTFGNPVFAPSTGVVPSADGTSAAVMITPRSNAQVQLTNKAMDPSIDIEKWNDEGEAPAYDATGALTNDGFAGDFDGAPGKALEANTPLPISFTISNDGNEDLVNVAVSDQLTGGEGAVTGLSCDFGPLGGPAADTTWDGPFRVGAQFECTGTLPALANGATHADLAKVTGIGIESEKSVDDEDPWNGYVPDPSIDIEKWNDEGEGPEYDETGALTNDGYPGDFEGAPGKALVADQPLPISFTVSNDGDEVLEDVVVSDELTGGEGAVADLVCTFPDGSTGTEWAGPFEIAAQFTCTGTLPALPNGATHADLSKVTGIGIDSRTKVDDEDPWNAYVPDPSIDIEKWNTEVEGEGPAYDETGALTNDGYSGDFDEPRGKPLRLDTPMQINFTISNDGDEVLEDVVVSDELTDGAGTIDDLVCTFPDGSTGTEWAGPFEVAAQFTCTGTLPGLGEGQTHADLSKVTGIGIDSRTKVDDEDPWNGYVPGPSVDIEKWSDEGERPEYDETGLLLNDGFKGDFDNAPGKGLTAGKDQKINFTISNDGQEPLIDLRVSDKLTGGVGEIQGLVCTFPDDSTGTEWAGPFAVGAQFECTGTLKGLAAGDLHSDRVTVSGTGLYSGITVGDEDDWHGAVPKSAGLSVTGATGIGALVLAALLLLGGGGALLVSRRKQADA